MAGALGGYGKSARPIDRMRQAPKARVTYLKKKDELMAFLGAFWAILRRFTSHFTDLRI